MATDPTPEQIRERTAEIRKNWSPRERARRTSIRRIGWLPPLYAEAEIVLGFGPTSEFDGR